MQRAIQTETKMNVCQNCGNENAASSHFCRYCGERLMQQYSAPQKGQDPNVRRPYSWQTDEFRTNAEARHTLPELPQQMARPQINYAPQPFAQNGPRYLSDPSYHCPRCGTTALPILERRISSAGWITFSLLLVFTIIFFWIGLLMKEDTRVCPICGLRLS